MTTDQPVPRIPASQWLQDHAEAQAKQAEADKLLREQAEAKKKAKASSIVDNFMLSLSGGNNPWSKPPRSELDLGSGDEDVLTMAKDELKDLGYKAQVRHPRGVGPGGRGAMEESWTDETTWRLYVQRPGK